MKIVTCPGGRLATGRGDNWGGVEGTDFDLMWLIITDGTYLP
jgi:hypothetical protein